MTTKMLPCPACCPARPDLGYPKAGRVRHEWDVLDWNADPVRWAWRCDNCGHFKTPRGPQARSLIDWETCTAAEAARLSLPKLARFHCWNPNGALAEWKAFGELIDAARAAGVVKGGFWLAYGPNGYHLDALYKLATTRKPKAFAVHYTAGAIRETIERGRAKLDEALAAAGRTLAEIAP